MPVVPQERRVACDSVPVRVEMLSKTRELLEALTSRGVRFCHWKSNRELDKALRGDTDLDLLVDRPAIASFRTILLELGLRPAQPKDSGSYPGVEHYFALDDPSGKFVHVHAYYQVVTGESLAKSLRLPLAEMLLSNIRLLHTVPVPTADAELLIFTLRMMMKHTSLVELLLLAREGSRVHEELAWLRETASVPTASQLIHR